MAVIDGGDQRRRRNAHSVGKDPESIAVNPATNRVYVANSGSNSVTVIDGATNAVVGSPIPVGVGPIGIAVNPSTNRVYVVNFNSTADHGSVTVVDGSTNAVIGAPVTVGAHPLSAAVNPVINRIYVADGLGRNVSEIDGATNTVIGNLFPIDSGSGNVAVNPDNNRIYVVGQQGNAVTVIDGATNAVVGTPVKVQDAAEGIAVNPVTGRVYVATQDNSTVDVIGVPFSVTPSTTSPGTAVTTTWSSLFGPNRHDFVGYFESGAPNTSPLTQRFVSGNVIGGIGLPDGSLELPIPAGLVPGRAYEVRFVSGLSGGTMAQTVEVPPATADDTFDANSGIALTVPAPGLLANDTPGNWSTGHGRDQPCPRHAGAPGERRLHLHGHCRLHREGQLRLSGHQPVWRVEDGDRHAAGHRRACRRERRVHRRRKRHPQRPAPGVLLNDTDADSPALQATLKTARPTARWRSSRTAPSPTSRARTSRGRTASPTPPPTGRASRRQRR